MGYTYQQLMAMGGKPVQTGSSGIPKKKYTYDELIAAGGKPANTQTVEGQKKYPVAPLGETREQKLTRLQNEAKQADAESKKANSALGFLGNAGKAFVETVAPSEVGLGKSIAAIATDPSVYVDSHNSLIDTNLKLKKLIEAKDAKGEDTTKLKQIYNSNADLASEHAKEIDAYGKNLPSNEKLLGQIGGTALDILAAGTYGKAANGLKTATLGKAKPVIQAGVEAIAKPTGIGTLKGAGKILGGAATGYAYDVTQGAQGNRGEDRTGANAFIPGAGTLTAAIIPAVIETYASLGNRYSKDARVARVIEKRTKELDDIENNYVSIRKQVAGNQGDEAKKILASTDLLQGAVDTDGTIRTEGAIKELNDFLKPQEDVIYKNLVQEGKKIPLSQVEKQLKTAVDTSGVKGGARLRALKNVEDDIAGYALDADKNGMINISDIHQAKVDKYANINYLNPESKKIDKVIAKTLKQIVENNTESIDVKKVNTELSKYYAVQKLLEKLDGKKVKGGKLGKYFAQTIGAVVGSHFGPLGAIAGSEVGGAIKGAAMASKLAGKTGNNLVRSEAMNAALKTAETRRLPVKSLPSEYTNELPTIPFGKPGVRKGSKPIQGLPTIVY